MRASKSGMIFGMSRLLRVVVFIGGGVVLSVIASAQSASADVDNTRDTLVYKDGDRLHGHLVQEANGVIIFQSPRFGELRVPSKQAVVIKAAKKPKREKAVEVVAQGIKPAPSPKEEAEEEQLTIWDRFSPAQLTAKLRDIFGPWHGKFAFSTESFTQGSHTDNTALDGGLTRKFKHDSVDLAAHYNYEQTDGTPTSDMWRGIASWRHDFTGRLFTQYRPTAEWDRIARRSNASQDVTLQQEIGGGFTLLAHPGRTFRLGASENLFDVWTYGHGGTHNSKVAASLFEEAQFALPWRMTLSQRGVWYPDSPARTGWENSIELDKKLTETLSVAVRDELRRNNPDGTSPDYTRLRLMFGLDF